MAMNNYEVSDNIGHGMGGGYGMSGGFGGALIAFIVIILIVVLLFRGNHGFGGGHEGGHRDGEYGDARFAKDVISGAHCGVTNCKVDSDVFKNRYELELATFKQTAEVLEDGAKTRALIEGNYVKDLERKIVERDLIIATKANEAFTAGLISGVKAELGEIRSNMLQKPPAFGDARYQCLAPTRECGTERRGCGDNFAF